MSQAKPQPKFFTQWRSSRSPDGQERLYVCAFWRAWGRDGKAKQAGCSYSTERHGIEGAALLAIQKAKKLHPVAKTADQIINELTW